MFLQNLKSVTITVIGWETFHPVPPHHIVQLWLSLDFDYILSFFYMFKKFLLH
jgi:hypothetical protein